MVTAAAFYQMVGEETPKRRQGQGQWDLSKILSSHTINAFCQLHLPLLASTNIVTMGKLFVSSSIDLELRPSSHLLTDLFM